MKECYLSKIMITDRNLDNCEHCEISCQIISETTPLEVKEEILEKILKTLEYSELWL